MHACFCWEKRRWVSINFCSVPTKLITLSAEFLIMNSLFENIKNCATTNCFHRSSQDTVKHVIKCILKNYLKCSTTAVLEHFPQVHAFWTIFGLIKRLAVRTIFKEKFALLCVGETLLTFKVRCLSRSRSMTVAAVCGGVQCVMAGK